MRSLGTRSSRRRSSVALPARKTYFNFTFLFAARGSLQGRRHGQMAGGSKRALAAAGGLDGSLACQDSHAPRAFTPESPLARCGGNGVVVTWPSVHVTRGTLGPLQLIKTAPAVHSRRAQPPVTKAAWRCVCEHRRNAAASAHQTCEGHESTEPSPRTA